MIEGREIVTDEEFLRQPCGDADPKEVTDIILNLFATLIHHNNGVGLAANQIGIQKKVAVVTYFRPFALVNPVLLDWKSPIDSDEGCLSLPGVYKTVRRYKEITILNNGRQFRLFNEEAIVAMHEINHLYGLLLYDFEVGKYESYYDDMYMLCGRSQCLS